EDVPRTEFRRLRSDVVHAAEVLAYLGVSRGSESIEHGHRPNSLLDKPHHHATSPGIANGVCLAPQRSQSVGSPGKEQVVRSREALRLKARSMVHVGDRERGARDLGRVWKSIDAIEHSTVSVRDRTLVGRCADIVVDPDGAQLDALPSLT